MVCDNQQEDIFLPRVVRKPGKKKRNPAEGLIKQQTRSDFANRCNERLNLRSERKRWELSKGGQEECRETCVRIPLDARKSGYTKLTKLPEGHRNEAAEHESRREVFE